MSSVISPSATKSVQRFVVNNFIDKSRQETIDIVLGSGVPEKAFLLRDLVREAVGEKMKAREKEYTQARSFHVHVGTWNVNGKLPGEDLFPWVASGVDVVPEFVVMAFQESEWPRFPYLTVRSRLMLANLVQSWNSHLSKLWSRISIEGRVNVGSIDGLSETESESPSRSLPDGHGKTTFCGLWLA